MTDTKMLLEIIERAIMRKKARKVRKIVEKALYRVKLDQELAGRGKTPVHEQSFFPFDHAGSPCPATHNPEDGA